MKFKPKVIHKVVTTTENGKEVSKYEEDIVHHRCQVCGRSDDELRKDGYLPESKHYNQLSFCKICGKPVCHKCLIEIPGACFSDQVLTLYNSEFPLAYCPGCAKIHKTTLDELKEIVEAKDKFVNVISTNLKRISTTLRKPRNNTPTKHP